MCVCVCECVCVYERARKPLGKTEPERPANTPAVDVIRVLPTQSYRSISRLQITLYHFHGGGEPGSCLPPICGCRCLLKTQQGLRNPAVRDGAQENQTREAALTFDP